MVVYKLQKVMNVPDNVLRQYIDQIFTKYDRDRSFTLDVNELANFFNDVFYMLGDPRRVTQNEAQYALRAIDANNDGKASKMELFQAFKRILSQQAPGYGQGGYGQGGYAPNNYNQGGYNQGSWGQGGNNQGSYNQGGYNQGGYNQGGYNQGGWGQGGYNQPQNSYNQGYGNQGGWGQPAQNQGWSNNQNYTAWGPNSNGGWSGGSQPNRW